MPSLFGRARARARERSLMGDWSGGQIDVPMGWSSAAMGPNMRGEEQPCADFLQAAHVYKANGPVFACNLARMKVFTEARMLFRQMKDGRPGDLFDEGHDDLALLRNPWSGGHTTDLLARMIQDVDLVGNSFVVRRGGKLRRLRPDWVTIVVGSETDPELAGDAIDGELLGYIYHPHGASAGVPDENLLMPREVAHWAPIPDPMFMQRGMSWMTPISREMTADNAATTHKLRYFDNGAVSGLVATLPSNVTPDVFERFMAKFNAEHQGANNAYKTMFIGGGATITNAGNNLQQLTFTSTQGAGETRIAAAAGVPPIIAGFSEGLQAATYSNYSSARRAFADQTIRPLWRSAAQALSSIVDVPDGAELWYDDRDVAFLREDRKDSAEIQGKQAQTIRALIDAGYDSDTVVPAVTAENFRLLEHSGLYSVQLRPANSEPDGSGAPAKSAPISPDSVPTVVETVDPKDPK
ncbi:phage portal protein [Nocardiopsis ganjiahuensis]|uniref:phage portal protein n=1 Tax=Nocardiopsis ganjiahuensis TaxID=239984 RepID=UPI0003495DAB|nr:phage portal protein [Nocardiopsis ganjiahuensis]